MRRLAVVVLCLLLSGCADRLSAPVVPGADRIGTPYRIFAGTTRAPRADGSFGRDRVREVGFLDLTVTVPPAHRPGRMRLGHDTPDPETDFALARLERLPSAAAFREALASDIARRDAPGREVTLYVHGYNNSFADGAFRMAQILHDLSVPGTPVHFSWPSATNPLGYVHDRDSVLAARDGLETLLREVDRAGAGRILLVGHSMGTLLIMETLRQIEIADPGWSARRLSGVVLVSPDIAVDLFKSQVDRFETLPRPFAVFVSQRDRALRLSARLTGVRNRLGSLSDPADLAEFPVTLVDVTAFDSGPFGHFAPGTSPALIQILSQSAELDDALQRDRAGQSGLLPGTVLTVQNATQVILSPGLFLPN